MSSPATSSDAAAPRSERLAQALDSLNASRSVTDDIRASWRTADAFRFGFYMASGLLWTSALALFLPPVYAYAHGQDGLAPDMDRIRVAVFTGTLLLTLGFRPHWQGHRAHRSTAFLTDTVILCAQARNASGEDRSSRLEVISHRMRAVERVIRNARRKHLRKYSWARRKEAAHHARQVVRRLRETYSQIHSDDGDQKLTDLANLLMDIADRYAQGRVSQLLPADQLQNRAPVKDYDTLKLAAVLVVFIITGVGLYVGGLGDIALSIAAAGSGLTFLVLFGERSQEMWDRYNSMINQGL